MEEGNGHSIIDVSLALKLVEWRKEKDVWRFYIHLSNVLTDHLKILAYIKFGCCRTIK